MLRNKKQLIIYLSAIFLVGVLLLVYEYLRSGMASQNMAERWTSGQEHFSQVSVFFPADQKKADLNTVSNLETYINGIVNESADSDTGHWIDTFSSNAVPAKAAKNEDSDTISVNMIGVGDDYFSFHPLELVDGNYFYQDSLRSNGAVLDESAAWSIFFSLNVTGMRFRIDEQEFIVQGVVKREDHKDIQAAYTKEAIIYVNYDLLSEMTDDASLLCYEAVIPSPIHHYAKNLLLDYYRGESNPEKGSVAVEGEIPVEIIENTARFSYASVMKHLLNYRKCGTATHAIAYPYWENAARMLLNRLTVIFLLILLLTGYLLVMTAWFVIKKYRRRAFRFKKLTDKLILRFTYKNSM